MEKSLTVGELKRALEGLPNNLPVYASTALRRIKPGVEDWNWYVDEAKFIRASGINDKHFSIKLGDPFGW